MKPGFDYIGITTPFYCHDGQGHILMHRRSKNCRDEQGTWDPGSGQLEHGLTLEANVLKEVKEEYGCIGTIQGELPAHDIFRWQESEKTHWLAVPYFVYVRKDDVRIAEPDKIDEIGWFHLSYLPSPLHSGFAQTLKRFPSLFRRHIG